MIQLGRFLGKLLAPLLKTGLLLIRNVFKTLAKSVLVPLGLTAAATATDGAIRKKTFWIWYGSISIFKRRLERYHENN